MYCVSHIQSYFMENMTSTRIENLSLLVENALEVADKCLGILTPPHVLNSTTKSQISFTYMDLFPTVVNALYHIERSDVWARGASGIGSRRKHVDILDDFCSSQWPARYALPLASMINDLWHILRPRHITSLKVNHKIVASNG